MKAVVNTSVLLVLGKLCYLELAKKLFDKLVIGKSVFEEIKDGEVSKKVERLFDAGFAEVVESKKQELMNLLSPNLGSGEAETIALT